MGRISSGLSGLSLSHSDTGGYTMIKKFGLEYLRSKELLVRWMEMTAVLDVIYRTHQGNLPEDSWQVYTDDSTLSCFKRSIALHKLFVPYRKGILGRRWLTMAFRGTSRTTVSILPFFVLVMVSF
eukprot:m.52269 g.52269  ORF g.52269 m.52269 type:complete len:125 (-) comp11293_c0_seq1:598-972(-)